MLSNKKHKVMKTFFFISFIFTSLSGFSQTDSTATSMDTLDIYVINSTNRLVQIGSSYALLFRDLKSLREIHSINFQSSEEVNKFFATSFRSMEQDAIIIGEIYSVRRNKLSKNIIRVADKSDGYMLLSYDSLEKMQVAFNRLLE